MLRKASAWRCVPSLAKRGALFYLTFSSQEKGLGDELIARNISNSLPPRFAADVMLGKTAKWLRMLGFDTFYDNRAGDHFLQDLCRNENRILLTRDTLLQQSMPPKRSYLVVQNLPRQQLAEISRVFNLDRFRLPCRCAVCNGELYAVEKIKIREKVPPYVFNTQLNFSQCQQCQKIYWPGTHLSKIKLFIENIDKPNKIHSI